MTPAKKASTPVGRYLDVLIDLDEGLAATAGEREARVRGALESVLAVHVPTATVRAAAADAWSAVLDAEEALATDLGDRRRDNR